MKADIVIVGGAGHIGLPLGMLFANKGKKVILYDKNKDDVRKINNLQMPFISIYIEILLIRLDIRSNAIRNSNNNSDSNKPITNGMYKDS